MASRFFNPFVSDRHDRLVGFVIWLLIAAIFLAAGAWFWRNQIEETLARDARAELAQFDKLHANVTTAFDELQRTATSTPCSNEFIRELRRVAFKPDGLNEFMYAPQGIVTCSTSMASRVAVPLGPPDIDRPGKGDIDLWVNKRLDMIGLSGVVGSVVLQEPFALVIPPQASWSDASSWLRKEFVVATGGRVWHLSGESGTFAAASAQRTEGESMWAIHGTACSDAHPFCVALETNLAQIAFDWRAELILAVGVVGFYAYWPASVAHRSLKKYWSLESRFRRNLDAASIVCAYQPILDLRTGAISSCEVLARWRDVDGSIVPPDKFIDLVASAGQTLEFTKMVADRAYAELSANLPQGTKLQVNFNIFPRDLDCEKLRHVFSAFEADRDRFPLALEIVENDEVLDNVHGEIEALARHGIRTYIDDFGNGYSSIHRVASLAIHGVKLDRSFAMAPNESLMARMLVHALDMIGSSGREIVVEGVETQDRLDLLLESERVAYAQGYLISKPLPIGRLVEFLANHDAKAVLARASRAAAA
ncbi:EAL domain-containing protein [Hyphomicrobium sp.]|uniref:EAL domain-containing protein n=1 Tax=Hyphomicrobium sp. TaxID=82 RepID=UPI002E30F746|nr:EAL domain-containing protein [Hyphomicrobium sp.]HEX2840235.1 EAL domain-containing protein [Hyphomicrobium sp.]